MSGIYHAHKIQTPLSKGSAFNDWLWTHRRVSFFLWIYLALVVGLDMLMRILKYSGPIIPGTQDLVCSYIPRGVPTFELLMETVDNLMGLLLCNTSNIFLGNFSYIGYPSLAYNEQPWFLMLSSRVFCTLCSISSRNTKMCGWQHPNYWLRCECV